VAAIRAVGVRGEPCGAMRALSSSGFQSVSCPFVQRGISKKIK